MPTWNFKMTSKSSKVLTANLTELIISGTSGLSKDLVALDTAVSIAELRHWKELRRMYVKLALRVPAGTNPLANAVRRRFSFILDLGRGLCNILVFWKHGVAKTKFGEYAPPHDSKKP